MRFKAAAILAALALLTLASAHARVQTQQQEQNDEAVIDDFVTKRGFIIELEKPSAKPKPRTRRKPGSGGVAKVKPSGGVNQGGGSAASPSDVAGQKVQPAADSAESDASLVEDGVQIVKASTLPALGLGYSIYMRDEATGGILPAPAGKSYQTGDAIFMVLEPSADGYLYVFNAENGKDPVMIYPSVLLHGGENAVRSHIRETFPEYPTWPFRFYDPPSNEHVYIVLSREPLAGVPTGEALRKFCGKNTDECDWRPTAAQWSRIYAASLDRAVRMGEVAQVGAEPVMPLTLQRGIRIKKDAPKPMNVRVNKSPNAPLLVTKIELLHK
ncbi:MAG TPA: DUF4384 domain-containing protein [Pyrinomonadaceae bacterium]|jgi:hypothetical protein|nr:DUF4384 domain-containing protein [Pyrinomonadaceae bacterium]